MILVVGLGNPGCEYENTRHNIGFMLIDELADSTFTDASSAKFKGKLYKKGSLLLLKPQTFMNLSGNSVKSVVDFYKPSRIIVVHDDIDLDFGAVKFKIGGSSGGHNGIRSIDGAIGNGYERIRIGMGRGKGSAKSFVLSKFEPCDGENLTQILSHVKAALRELLVSDIKDICQKYTIKKGFEN